MRQPDRRLRGGFTLAEIVVTMTIIVVLAGLMLLGGRAVRNAMRRSTAEGQLALISKSVDQYASYWPKWKSGSTTVADQGWPDFIAGRLFDPTAFTTIVPFNDHLTFNVQGGLYRPNPITENHDYVGIGDVLSANICLTYALTSGTGKGPYIPPNDEALVKDVLSPVVMEHFVAVGGGQDQAIKNNPLLPARLPAGSGADRARVLVDPWGTPYRFFWVQRDATAQNGLLPVVTANPADPLFRVAVGYVLESAGPDRKFGNVWKASPTNSEFNDAADNLIIKP